MKLCELAAVMPSYARGRVEVRKEPNARNSSYKILCQGMNVNLYGNKVVDQVYPVVFDGETVPSIVVWVRDEGK